MTLRAHFERKLNELRDEMLRMDGYNPDQHKFDPMLPYHMQPKY